MQMAEPPGDWLPGEEQQGGVENSTSESPTEPPATLTLRTVSERAVQQFATGAAATIVFVLTPPLLAAPNVDLCCLVKQAIHDLYESKTQLTLICRSPERTDLRLAQEEALGYLLGAAAGLEMLPQEVRNLGKKVEYYADAEKKAAEKAKGTLKDRKRAAGAAAKKDAEAAATLEATLAGLEANAAAKRAARRAKIPPLELPDPKAKIIGSCARAATTEPPPQQQMTTGESVDGALSLPRPRPRRVPARVAGGRGDGGSGRRGQTGLHGGLRAAASRSAGGAPRPQAV